MTHALIRTSPKGPGQKFVGRCNKCGAENLPMSAAQQDCPADGLVSDEKALLDILKEQGPMTAPELKPCPWCQEIPRLYPAQDCSGWESVECANTKCPMQPSTGYGPCEESVSSWNTRAPDPDLDAHIEAAHPDDAAVDRFAEAMKAKLAAARAKGRKLREARVEGMREARQRILEHQVEQIHGEYSEGHWDALHTVEWAIEQLIAAEERGEGEP